MQLRASMFSGERKLGFNMKVPSMPIAYKNPEVIRKTNPRLFLSISYDAVKSHQPATWVAGKGTTPNDL